MAQIKYASNGKRDLHSLEYEYDEAFDKLDAEEWVTDNNKKLVKAYLLACKRGRAKSGRQNKKVGKSSLYRILGLLRLLSNKWIDKDFDKVKPAEWESFYDRMEDDKIKNEYGKKFKPSTKAKIYKTVRKFLKYQYGNNQGYPSFCENWVTVEEVPTKQHLTRQEVEQMINAASTLRVKTYLMMLFDGGFRIEELANLKWTDVIKQDKGYYKAHVRKETSKTKQERYVSLWLATDLIESYKKLMQKEKDYSPNNFLFTADYQGLFKTVKRIGQKVLDKNISPHIMRHSSATYYSNVIKTYQQFCTRYGWKLNSRTAQIYFHSVDEEAVAEQTKDHEIAQFRADFEMLKLQNKQKDQELEALKNQLAKLVADITDIKPLLKEATRRGLIKSP